MVAEEVRNLALRAAEVAKSTSSLIEKTVIEVTESEKTAKETEAVFAEVADLLNGIAVSSSEQAVGIDQLNTSMAEMDKVVQSNAATAGETADASEKMSEQAGRMIATVEQLVMLVGDRGGDARNTVSEAAEGTGALPRR